jgi:AraC-like DNA-binding protein
MKQTPSSHRLYIKNMVCNRCILTVERILDELEIPRTGIRLGEADLNRELSAEETDQLTGQLHRVGFELIDDRKTRLVEKIKNIIVTLVHETREWPKQTLSAYLADQLHYDYKYLSNLFSEAEHTTIEKFLISQKIERVKELLEYDELSLGEIADQVGYSSSGHLSNQFKKVTGLTPGQFKKGKDHTRRPLDKL